MTSTLDTARDAVAAIKRELLDDQAVLKRAEQDLYAAQQRVAAIKVAQATNGLDRKLADAMRALGEAEEQAIDIWRDQLAADILRKQATDPYKYRAEIAADLQKLKDAAPNEMCWPINKPFRISPLVSQALTLLPTLDATTTPIHLLHGESGADWPTRRKAILAAESEPQQAA